MGSALIFDYRLMNIMASRYAFAFAKTEYHHIGPFRFPILKCLKEGERIDIDKLQRQSNEQLLQALELARKISAEKGITQDEALELIQKSGEGDDEFAREYAADLLRMMDAQRAPREIQADVVTSIIQRRGELEIDGEWKRVSDWGLEDTQENVDEVMSDEIFKFAQWERAGWPEDNPEEGKPKRRSKSSTASSEQPSEPNP